MCLNVEKIENREASKIILNKNGRKQCRYSKIKKRGGRRGKVQKERSSLDTKQCLDMCQGRRRNFIQTLLLHDWFQISVLLCWSNLVFCTFNIRVVTFKYREQKNSVIHKSNNLGNKSHELTKTRFFRRIFVSESMSHENQQLAYKYQQLKSARKIHSTWFFNNVLSLKLTGM